MKQKLCCNLVLYLIFNQHYIMFANLWVELMKLSKGLEFDEIRLWCRIFSMETDTIKFFLNSERDNLNLNKKLKN